MDLYNQLWLEIIDRYPLLSPQEEQTLIEAYQISGDAGAREKLILSNIRFVYKVARPYLRRLKKSDPIDLIQEGIMGLIHSIDVFDLSRGYRLITYSTHWIRAYILQYLFQNHSMVRTNTTRLSRQLLSKLSRIPSQDSPDYASVVSELATQFDSSGEDIVKELGRLRTSFVSDDTLKYQRVESEQGLELEREETRHLLDSCVSELESRDQFIINNRFLVDAPLTLQEIADSLGLSRERIRQIESSALKKLKQKYMAAS